MNQFKIDYNRFLFEEDYSEIVENCVDDYDPAECIEKLFQLYKNGNPSFLDKLLHKSLTFAWGDISPSEMEEGDYTIEEKSDLDYFHSIKFRETATIETIDSAAAAVYKIMDDGGYTSFYLEVLKYKLAGNQTQEKGKESDSKKLTGKEKIYLLKLLSETGWQKSITKNTSLAKILSELIGLEYSTIISDLQEYNSHWNISITEDQKKDRVRSLLKIETLLDKAGNSTITSKMTKALIDTKKDLGIID